MEIGWWKVGVDEKQFANLQSKSVASVLFAYRCPYKKTNKKKALGYIPGDLKSQVENCNEGEYQPGPEQNIHLLDIIQIYTEDLLYSNIFSLSILFIFGWS